VGLLQLKLILILWCVVVYDLEGNAKKQL